MAFDIEKFRRDFPEFSESSIQVYSDALITFWAGIGDLTLNVERWDTFLDYGMALFVAHNITMAISNQETASLGGIAGTNFGLVTNESAGDVSVGLDINAIIEEGGGNYNMTSYGRSFLRLARIVGSGGAVAI